LAIDPNSDLLHNIWERFALYDYNAKLLQNNFYKIQAIILIVGIAASVLSLSQTQMCELYTHSKLQAARNSVNLGSSNSTVINEDSCAEVPGLIDPLLDKPIWDRILNYIIIILPISISIMVAASNYFRSGNKWILLRFTAEQVKREIYYFRTKTEKYKIDLPISEDEKIAMRRKFLVKQVEILSNKLMESEINSQPLQKYKGNIPPIMIGKQNDGDNGLKDLNGDDYVRYRVEDQIQYYENRTRIMNKRLRIMQWSIFLIGGIGTFIAAIGLQLWVSLTTLLIASISTYLMYRQIEHLLMKYNQNIVALQSIKSWWLSLSELERKNKENSNMLVETTEIILQTELAVWLQNMHNALLKLGQQQQQKDQDKQKQLEQDKQKQLEQDKHPSNK
jgi:hypothetical protein